MEILEKHGKTWELKSKFCAKEFKSSFATKVREHYLGVAWLSGTLLKISRIHNLH
jgi:hypothetical protein